MFSEKRIFSIHAAKNIRGKTSFYCQNRSCDASLVVIDFRTCKLQKDLMLLMVIYLKLTSRVF